LGIRAALRGFVMRKIGKITRSPKSSQNPRGHLKVTPRLSASLTIFRDFFIAMRFF
jgi:hypothetical protein